MITLPLLFWSLTMTGYFHCGTEAVFGNGGCHPDEVNGVVSTEVGMAVDANVRITTFECTTSGAPACSTAFTLTDGARFLTTKPCITNWLFEPKNEACAVKVNAVVTVGSRMLVYTFPNGGTCPEDVYVSCRASGVRLP